MQWKDQTKIQSIMLKLKPCTLWNIKASFGLNSKLRKKVDNFRSSGLKKKLPPKQFARGVNYRILKQTRNSVSFFHIWAIFALCGRRDVGGRRPGVDSPGREASCARCDVRLLRDAWRQAHATLTGPSAVNRRLHVPSTHVTSIMLLSFGLL